MYRLLAFLTVLLLCPSLHAAPKSYLIDTDNTAIRLSWCTLGNVHFERQSSLSNKTAMKNATANIIVLYILILKFLERSLEDKSVCTEFPALSLHFISS